jgi:P4 family phage/plasmid primase-like protien
MTVTSDVSEDASRQSWRKAVAEYKHKPNLERTVSEIGDPLIATYNFKTMKELGILHYDKNEGIHKPGGKGVIEWTVRHQVNRDITKHELAGVIYYIETMTLADRSDFDKDPNWLHVGNGWVNLQTREFKDNISELLSLFKIPHNYDPEAKNPEQLQFFEELFEEGDLPAVQKFFGYLILPDNRYKKAFLGIGPKDTGKSKFTELVEKFAGMAISHVTLHDMDKHNHNVVKITQSKVNTASEVSKYKLKDVSMFKATTGGDECTFRAIYGEPFDCRVRAKTLVVTNDKPNFDDMDRTFVERWVVFKFTNVFHAGEDMDPNIMERLTTPAEMSGLLNYAVEGLAMLQNDGYFKKQSWEDVKADWDSLDSKIAEYYKDHIITKEGAFIPTGELYEDYCKHTENPLSDKMFGRELKKFGVLRKKQRIAGRPTWVYEGITIEGRQEAVPIVPMNSEYVTPCEEVYPIEGGAAISWVQQVHERCPECGIDCVTKENVEKHLRLLHRIPEGGSQKN